MRLRQTIGFSLALLVISGGAVVNPALAEATEHRHAGKRHIAENRTRPADTAVHRSAQHTRSARRVAGARHVHAQRQDATRHVAHDRLLGSVRAIGKRELGSASWYGGRHLGRRTASGERLDAIHPTAAHRTLPLHSLARVTNLNNGRSCIVVVTDRGPTSQRLVIDLSPRAADELQMRQEGIVPVAVEPVAAVTDAQN